MVDCPTCPNRYFMSKEALHQHMKYSSTSHPFCYTCDRAFINENAYDSHTAARHPPSYDCNTCDRSFRSEMALSDHYRGSSAHPNCQKCGQGFEDDKACDKHHSTAHPRVLCSPCGKLVYEDSLQDHYSSSTNHPQCRICVLAFKDDRSYDEHAMNVHPEMRCQQCKRQFETVDALKEHYQSSPKHPTCFDCDLGFQDDPAYIHHWKAVHASPMPRSGNPSQAFSPANSRLKDLNHRSNSTENTSSPIALMDSVTVDYIASSEMPEDQLVPDYIDFQSEAVRNVLFRNTLLIPWPPRTCSHAGSEVSSPIGKAASSKGPAQPSSPPYFQPASLPHSPPSRPSSKASVCSRTSGRLDKAESRDGLSYEPFGNRIPPSPCLSQSPDRTIGHSETNVHSTEIKGTMQTEDEEQSSLDAGRLSAIFSSLPSRFPLRHAVHPETSKYPIAATSGAEERYEDRDSPDAMYPSPALSFASFRSHNALVDTNIQPVRAESRTEWQDKPRESPEPGYHSPTLSYFSSRSCSNSSVHSDISIHPMNAEMRAAQKGGAWGSTDAGHHSPTLSYFSSRSSSSSRVRSTQGYPNPVESIYGLEPEMWPPVAAQRGPRAPSIPSPRYSQKSCVSSREIESPDGRIMDPEIYQRKLQNNSPSLLVRSSRPSSQTSTNSELPIGRAMNGEGQNTWDIIPVSCLGSSSPSPKSGIHSETFDSLPAGEIQYPRNDIQARHSPITELPESFVRLVDKEPLDIFPERLEKYSTEFARDPTKMVASSEVESTPSNQTSPCTEGTSASDFAVIESGVYGIAPSKDGFPRWMIPQPPASPSSPSRSCARSTRSSSLSDCSSLGMSRSPDVDSPTDLAKLPVSPEALTPNDLPDLQVGQETGLMKSHQPETEGTVDEFPSISSPSTMLSSHCSGKVSPQGQNYVSFGENILDEKLPDTPTSPFPGPSPANPARPLGKHLGENDFVKKDLRSRSKLASGKALYVDDAKPFEKTGRSSSTTRINSLPFASVGSAAVSPLFHCRICRRETCDDITATMCGHIFCNKCIVEAIINKATCPVCATPALLYCLFRIDLSA